MDYLSTYQHIRGFNYVPSTAFHDIAFWRDYDETLVERELTYAQRLGLNNARIFLAYVIYEHDPAVFLDRVRHFVRTAYARGIGVMPVLWDSCFDDTLPTYGAIENKWIPNPGIQNLGPEFWPKGERYCRDLVDALDGEPGLLLWDVMNEPLITSWLWDLAEDDPERLERTARIWRFVHHFCTVMKATSTRHPITVGVAHVNELAIVGPDVDVLSFHDYSRTRAAIRAILDQGVARAQQFGKPVLLSETACLARGNPYDVTLEICQSVRMGWYLWELMIGVSRWRDIHGVVYPDGTIRDPSIVAAIRGFFRNRRDEIVPPNVDREGLATRMTRSAEEWLGTGSAPYADGLSILETLANLLEAGELVAMSDLPSWTVLQLTTETPENRMRLCRLLVAWTAALKPYLI